MRPLRARANGLNLVICRGWTLGEGHGCLRRVETSNSSDLYGVVSVEYGSHAWLEVQYCKGTQSRRLRNRSMRALIGVANQLGAQARRLLSPALR